MDYRVCYADTDAAGVVYHGRYIEMAERSRGLAVHAAGFTAEETRATEGLGFVVRGVSALYHQFAFLNDVLTVSTSIVDLGDAKSWWLTEVERLDEPICSVLAEVVVFNRADRSPQYLPEAVKAAFVRSLLKPAPQAKGRFRRKLA